MARVTQTYLHDATRLKSTLVYGTKTQAKAGHGWCASVILTPALERHGHGD